MSYFNMVSHNPPAIMVSIQCANKNPDGLKGLFSLPANVRQMLMVDTNSNIKNSKEFCVSIISEPFLEASNYTSIDAPYDVDEWKLSGLTQRSSQ
jgi:flavin reductase (DIM6/NTAB) family NADH-FMN oxidoreductase RutF